MTTGFQRETAKIYQFPVRLPAAIGAQRQQAQTAADLRASPLPQIMFGNAWYHEEAVRETDRVRKL